MTTVDAGGRIEFPDLQSWLTQEAGSPAPEEVRAGGSRVPTEYVVEVPLTYRTLALQVAWTFDDAARFQTDDRFTALPTVPDPEGARVLVHVVDRFPASGQGTDEAVSYVRRLSQFTMERDRSSDMRAAGFNFQTVVPTTVTAEDAPTPVGRPGGVSRATAPRLGR